MISVYLDIYRTEMVLLYAESIISATSGYELTFQRITTAVGIFEGFFFLTKSLAPVRMEQVIRHSQISTLGLIESSFKARPKVVVCPMVFTSKNLSICISCVGRALFV